jgi:putative redox protein
MPIEIVRADWVEGQVFVLRDRAGYSLVMTQPQGVHGADLLPLSLIGCLAWDVMAIVRKQRQPVEKLAMAAESERDAEPPWRFRSILIRYHFTGRGLSEAWLRRAVALSENKYCSIYATLRDAVALRSEIVISEKGVHGDD